MAVDRLTVTTEEPVTREQCRKDNSIRNPLPLGNEASNNQQTRWDVNTVEIWLGKKGRHCG